jgi:hypothetical protein
MIMWMVYSELWRQSVHVKRHGWHTTYAFRAARERVVRGAAARLRGDDLLDHLELVRDVVARVLAGRGRDAADGRDRVDEGDRGEDAEEGELEAHGGLVGWRVLEAAPLAFVSARAGPSSCRTPRGPVCGCPTQTRA